MNHINFYGRQTPIGKIFLSTPQKNSRRIFVNPSIKKGKPLVGEPNPIGVSIQGFLKREKEFPEMFVVQH